MKKRWQWFKSTVCYLGLALFIPGLVYAQQQPAGVVTAVQGKAQLTRPAAPTPAPLRFKDGVVVRDTIDTQEKSLARILFGGKSTVTVRELSRLEVREETLPTGATRSTIDLPSGAMLVHVARQLMRPGDEVIIRTTNAVASVRGSTIFVQSIAELAQSIFTQLFGSSVIQCLPPAICPDVMLASNSAADVTGKGADAQVSEPRTVSQDQANRILQESQVGKAVTEEGNRDQIAQAAVQEVGSLLDAAIEIATTGQTGGGTSGGGDPGKPTQGCTTNCPGEPSANLVVTKSDSPDPVLVEGTLTYTVTVKNDGPNAATGVTLKDTLPAGVNFVSATTGCSQAGGTVTCNLGAINKGDSATVTIQVSPTEAGEIENKAEGKGKETDPNPGNNTAKVTTQVLPSANLSVVKSDSPDPVTVGKTLTYTVTVKNNGPSPATGVTLKDTLPAGVNFVSATSGCSQAGGTVTCNLGTINKGDSATVTIQVSPTEAGEIENKAEGKGKETDPNTDNNTVKVTTKVLASANLSVTKSDFPDPVTVGNNLTYTVTVKNDGPSPATGVTLKDTLPAGVNFVSATSTQGNCSQSGGTVTCNLGTINKGNTATVTIQVSPTEAGEKSNTAKGEGNEDDPDTANNTATEITVVQSPPPAGGCQTAGNAIKNCGFETTGSIPEWNLTGAGSIITSMKDSSGNVVFKPTEKDHMAIIHTGTGAVNISGCGPGQPCQASSLSQSFKAQPGKVYLVTFDYNFMTNEFPTQSTTFNDKFDATLVTASGLVTSLASESRNSSTFKTDKPTITTSGSNDEGFTNFTLNAGNGYTDFTSASKTVVIDTENVNLVFTIQDVSDTAVDSGVLIDNVKIELDPPLYLLTNGQTLVGPSQNPLVKYIDQSATFDSVLVSSGPPPNGTPSVSLSGPLLKAERSNLDVPFSLLGLLDGSTLVSTSSDPLVWLQEGNYSLSTLKGTAIFDFWGTKTALDPETGVQVGTGKTVQHAGPLLQASGGATVSTQKVLKLDTALLEATAPIISLLGSATKQTELTTATSTMDLIKSKVISTGPVIAMDKSFINVANGPLINLTHGSIMKVTGDLLSLINKSKINVVNGPLINAAGAGSLLDVSGALVNFGGTGGNKIIVNNTITPTATLSGLPVSATFGGAINIGPNPVKNPSLGNISVTGSLISATNNGKINIKAP